MTERRESVLVYNALYAIKKWKRVILTHAEASALAQAYLEAQATITKLEIEAKRLADDAAAQRALVERLTNELNDRQK